MFSVLWYIIIFQLKDEFYIIKLFNFKYKYLKNVSVNNDLALKRSSNINKKHKAEEGSQFFWRNSVVYLLQCSSSFHWFAVSAPEHHRHTSTPVKYNRCWHSANSQMLAACCQRKLYARTQHEKVGMVRYLVERGCERNRSRQVVIHSVLRKNTLLAWL